MISWPKMHTIWKKFETKSKLALKPDSFILKPGNLGLKLVSLTVFNIKMAQNINSAINWPVLTLFHHFHVKNDFKYQAWKCPFYPKIGRAVLLLSKKSVFFTIDGIFSFANIFFSGQFRYYENPNFFQFSFEFWKLDSHKIRKTKKKTGNEIASLNLI